MADYVQGVPIEISDTFSLSGVNTDPTTIVYAILGPDGTTDTYTWPGDPEIAHPAAGQFVLSLAPPALPGLYSYDVDATGTVVASRKGSFNVIANAAASALVDWAVQGPCTPWCSSQAIWDCCGQPTETIDNVVCPVDMTAFAQEASELLYEFSDRLFAGSCEQTVRPCGTSVCGTQVLSRGHLVGWDNGWTLDGRRSCGCSPLSTVLLSGYPVREILEVLIDGVAVAPDTYRLDGWRHLVRTRDPLAPNTVLSWPGCQALDLPDTEDGTFSVRYRFGQDPPLVGSHAAAQLGCEIYRSCNGEACALPTGTTRVVRQGVVIEKMAFSAWGLQDGIWRTGIPMVDAFLSAYAAKGGRRPVTWSPASHLRYARKLGQ